MKNFKQSSIQPFGHSVFRHQLANPEPVTFIRGPKMAGARPIVATRPISIAMPLARPEF